MRPATFSASLLLFCLVCPAVALNSGCMATDCFSCRPCGKPVPDDVPRELEKQSLPNYVIEPPDILLVDAIRVVPLPPYKIQPLDVLLLQVTGTLPNEPISGLVAVEPDGTIQLGVSYGTVQVSGMTTDEARAVIEKQLKNVLKEPKASVSLAQSRAMQQIRGTHLVRPDGTIGLGVYGSVYLAGQTLEQAKAIIEAHLSQYLLKPEVGLDVYAYNSKSFYVIMDGAGYGEQVHKLPITGNETVLDAISQLNGLPNVSSKKIWVARPGNAEGCHEQILPVDWRSITMCGSSKTNYQLFPGDRLYVQSDSLIYANNMIAKILAPVERVLGVTLLGQQTILSFDRSILKSNNGGNNNGAGIP
jgi:polysaccharide biosynthesis/export protein